MEYIGSKLALDVAAFDRRFISTMSPILYLHLRVRSGSFMQRRKSNVAVPQPLRQSRMLKVSHILSCIFCFYFIKILTLKWNILSHIGSALVWDLESHTRPIVESWVSERGDSTDFVGDAEVGNAKVRYADVRDAEVGNAEVWDAYVRMLWG